MLKKIFIISAVLLMVVGVFFGIYIIAFKKDVNIDTVNDEYNQQNDIESMISQKMTNITSEPIVSATVDASGENILYYSAIDGRVWTMTLRGANKEVFKNETKGVPQSAKWSNDGKSVILTYDDGEIFVQNFEDNLNNKLRDGMDAVEWAGAGSRILYKYFDKNSNERTLNIANNDGSNWKKIADLPFRYASFTQVPSSIFVAFWPTEYATEETQLLTASTISNSEPLTIFSGKYGVDFSYSPDGKNILMSSVEDGGKNITLGIIDSKGQNYNDFKIPTIVQKTVWSKDGKTVYYAQPTDVPEGAVWPNDYNQKKFTTKDTFYKMDIESGKKERLIELDEIKEGVDAVDLFLSPTEDAIFFTNRENNLLYSLSL